jgi:nicotinamide-nucleotide amidase
MPLTLTAEVLTIGDELNRGEIIDTNSSYLAGQLTELGFHVRWRTSVTDEPADMAEALRTAAGRARVVVCSGGLGPTEDDRTVDVVSQLLGVEAQVDPAHKAKMTSIFTERNFTITPNNLRQVRVPGGARVLHNRKGLAPGFHVQLGSADLFFMPGVPREMKVIYQEGVTIFLQTLLTDGAKAAKRTWRVAGMGESHVDHALTGLLDGISDVTLHFRIAYPENLVTVVVRRSDEAEARRVLESVDAEVRRRLAGHLYGTDDETLAGVVGQLLKERGARLSVAESCTGGLLGELITDGAGASQWFVGGAISYSNDLKRSLVGVREETLKAHGAVSRETVIEMAEGANQRFGTQYAIAITGIAGPDGGTPEKPVGTVWIAVAGPTGTETRNLNWRGTRDQIRRVSAFSSLHLLYKTLTS